MGIMVHHGTLLIMSNAGFRSSAVEPNLPIKYQGFPSKKGLGFRASGV